MRNREEMNFVDLKNSRLLYEKDLPPFGYILIISILLLIIGVGFWSTQAYKTYIVRGEGIVVSDNKNYIMSEYTGEIIEMNFTEGDYVEEGDVLFEIKSTDLDIQLEQLNGKIKLYQTKIEQLEKLELSIKDDTNYFDENNIEDGAYFNRFNEYKSEISQYHGDLSQYQGQEYSAEQIESIILKNEEQISQVYYETLKSIYEEIAVAQTEIDDLRVQIAAINNGKTEYQICANTSGIVHMNELYKEGMVVQAAATIGSIASENDRYYISTYIAAGDRPRIDYGDRVDVAVQGLIENVYGTLPGSVYFIDSDITIGNNGGDSYFKIFIKPESDYLISKSGDKVAISNGMKVETRIKYDKITYFQYLMESIGVVMR